MRGGIRRPHTRAVFTEEPPAYGNGLLNPLSERDVSYSAPSLQSAQELMSSSTLLNPEAKGRRRDIGEDMHGFLVGRRTKACMWNSRFANFRRKLSEVGDREA